MGTPGVVRKRPPRLPADGGADGASTNATASTAAEEAAHGVHAPTEDVLAKRANWQA